MFRRHLECRCRGHRRLRCSARGGHRNHHSFRTPHMDSRRLRMDSRLPRSGRHCREAAPRFRRRHSVVRRRGTNRRALQEREAMSRRRCLLRRSWAYRRAGCSFRCRDTGSLRCRVGMRRLRNSRGRRVDHRRMSPVSRMDSPTSHMHSRRLCILNLSSLAIRTRSRSWLCSPHSSLRIQILLDGFEDCIQEFRHRGEGVPSPLSYSACPLAGQLQTGHDQHQ